MKLKHIFALNLKLHGEEASAVGGIGTQSANDSPTSVAAVAPTVVYGKVETAETIPSVTPVEQAPDRTAEYTKAKEQYKDLFESDFKSNLDRRMKGTTKELGSMKSILEPLRQYFGLENLKAMQAFIDSDIIPSIEGGYTAMADAIAQEDSDGDATASEAIPSAADLAGQGLALQTKLKAQGAEFDLQSEIDNPAVTAMLSKGLSLEQAYIVAHHDEILLRETSKTAAAQKEATIQDIRTRGLNQVAEHASKPAPPVQHITNPRNLTPAQKEDIDRRVARGEKISW